MPRNDGTRAYRPQYVPALQLNSDGLMVNNSAQTQAHVGMQKLLLERSGPPRANESAHMQRRQTKVNDFLQLTGKTEIYRNEKGRPYALPKIAGPQPVLVKYGNAKDIEAKRAHQLKEFGESSLGRVHANFVYGEIDDAMDEVAQRNKDLTRFKKLGMSQDEERKHLFKPLYDATKYLNEKFAKDGDPVRVKWREVQEDFGKLKIDLYFIYPNLTSQAEKGFSTWFGAHEAFDRY